MNGSPWGIKLISTEGRIICPRVRPMAKEQDSRNRFTVYTASHRVKESQRLAGYKRFSFYKTGG